MKKLLIGLVAVLLLGIGGMTLFTHFYNEGETYYTQVTTDGTKGEDRDTHGGTYVKYTYTLTGYDADGESRDLTFNVNRDTPLRRDAFLKMTWKENRGITRWEAVDQNDIPKKAQQALLK